MNRPKFCCGEIVDVKSPSVSLRGAEIIFMQYRQEGEILPRVQGGFGAARGGWYYETAASESNFHHEKFIHKRPDKHEPFSLESMKKKYSPDKVEA